MKRVLIISYYFPPMGMGGVQRMTKFARYLSDFGWEPTVLTVKPVAYYAHDPSLLDEVKGVRIERTESLDPLRLLQLLHKKGDVKTSQTPKGGGWLSRINNWFTRWFLIPDSKVLWRPFAKRAIQKLHKKTSFDLVMTSSPPHSAHALGAWMQSQYDIPWVADFRDDWMGEEYERGPTYLHNTINHSMARRIVRQTDAVISVSPPISQHLEFLRGSDVLTLYNGFDANDFKSKANSSPDPNRMTITYTGTLNALLDPEPLLKAVRIIIEEHPEIRSKIRIRFVGSAYGMDLESIIHSFKLQDVVEMTGYVSHPESVRALLESDVLLLLLSSTLSEGKVTGKVFEYLASGKPILGIVPEGEAAQMIRKFNAGSVVHPTDEKGMVDILLQIYKKWDDGKLESNPVCMQSLQKYERREQTRNIAKLFDTILSKLSGSQ